MGKIKQILNLAGELDCCYCSYVEYTHDSTPDGDLCGGEEICTHPEKEDCPTYQIKKLYDDGNFVGDELVQALKDSKWWLLVLSRWMRDNYVELLETYGKGFGKAIEDIDRTIYRAEKALGDWDVKD